MCKHVAEFKPDVVITEKGLSDLATHFLTKAGISAIRRLRKTDNNRIARACGATIVHRPEEIRESDIGTGAGLFEVKKIGDEFFTFIVDCKVGSPRRWCTGPVSPACLATFLTFRRCAYACRSRRLALLLCVARPRMSSTRLSAIYTTLWALRAMSCGTRDWSLAAEPARWQCHKA